MRGNSKLLVAMLAALICAFAAVPAAAEEPQATASATAKPRSFTESQKAILSNGVAVRVVARHRGVVKVLGQSSTFDKTRFRAFTRLKVVRFRGPGRRLVRLGLTADGRKAVASCQARKLRVRAGKSRRKGDLLRNTGQCKPKKVDLSAAGRCDFIGQQQGSLCLLPFPDNYYTVRDSSTATGRRVNLRTASMPENAGGTPIDAEPYRLNDGFSPGSTILLRVPGLDNPTALQKTAAAPLAHIGRYKNKNTPVVVIDAATGKRWPIWVEIDSKAGAPEETLLEIHPAKNFAAKHRYIVALRDLRNSAGKVIKAPAGFRYFRDQLPSSSQRINGARGRFEGIFKKLKSKGVHRADLYLAWDFTVASDENIAGRMLHIRDDAFGDLGDSDLDDGTATGGTVPFSVNEVLTFAQCGGDGCQDGEDNQIIRRIRGEFTVPCYLTNGCEAPARFTLDADGNPIQQGTYQANFDCIIPRNGVDGAAAAAGNRPAVYGHGLLGRANEVGSASQKTLAVAHGFVLCATDEIGFANEDIPNTIGILGDLGRFPELTDRVQQGLLNELLLGRLMIRPTGFVTNANFHVDAGDAGSASAIDPSNLYYSGISQGGILGGALTAVSPDFTRASLGVPAMTYSVLLPRSVDFDDYELIFNPSYPDPMSRPLALSLIQMLWDRSEPSGYAHRMTDNPLPNTPPHEVLMTVAFGDHQVTTWQADVEARTIGASARSPIVYDGRWPGVDQLWGIPRIQSYPFADSAIVYFDGGPVRPETAPDSDANSEIGTAPPPLVNMPNRTGDDPHGLPRREPSERQMVSDFLRPDTESAISDSCGSGLLCFSGGFTGP